METSCIVLAGGKSLRLGRDKVLENISNRSLLEQVVHRVSLLTGNIIIVSDRERTFLQLAGYPKLKIVTDIYPDKGPLGGIYTGLTVSTSFYNFVVASDMPFLNQGLLRHMMQLAGNFDLVAPRVGNLVEPLHAIYTKSCLAPIERMIKQQKLSVYQLLRLVRVRYVEAEEIERFDPKHLSFFNINTEADLKVAQDLARGDINSDKC